ncbi:MAG: DNA repair protein RecN, partial [Synechococcales cyanobacterium RU_4_20]|nr:DNA repair protein RecN [Synechococcales cyanobacterium RU_4_20]
YENDGGNACADLLGQAESVLLDMLPYDDGLQNLVDLVAEAITQVQEAGQQINSYGGDLETDPDRLAEIDSRISELKQICRKYGPGLEDAIAYAAKIRAELAGFDDEGQSLEALQAEADQAKARLKQACTQLRSLRQTAAKTLETQLLSELKPLAMEKVKFQVQLAPIAPTAQGADQICFLLSPNPGEPLQPLSETASGGEMSRFLLAMKACFSAIDSVGTLVFDEIDTGVSGRVSQRSPTNCASSGSGTRSCVSPTNP